MAQQAAKFPFARKPLKLGVIDDDRTRNRLAGFWVDHRLERRCRLAAYRFGERGILDVLDAQRVLRSVRADLLQARFQLQVARITLLQLSGRYASDSNLSQK